MDKQQFHSQFYSRLIKVIEGHPLNDSLYLNPLFMSWWDSLSPQQRKALEENIDARFKVLEEWKLQCPR